MNKRNLLLLLFLSITLNVFGMEEAASPEDTPYPPEFRCNICLDHHGVLISPPCSPKHLFHPDCAQQWAISSQGELVNPEPPKDPLCPICRHPFHMSELAKMKALTAGELWTQETIGPVVVEIIDKAIEIGDRTVRRRERPHLMEIKLHEAKSDLKTGFGILFAELTLNIGTGLAWFFTGPMFFNKCPIHWKSPCCWVFFDLLLSAVDLGYNLQNLGITLMPDGPRECFFPLRSLPFLWKAIQKYREYRHIRKEIAEDESRDVEMGPGQDER